MYMKRGVQRLSIYYSCSNVLTDCNHCHRKLQQIDTRLTPANTRFTHTLQIHLARNTPRRHLDLRLTRLLAYLRLSVPTFCTPHTPADRWCPTSAATPRELYRGLRAWRTDLGWWRAGRSVAPSPRTTRAPHPCWYSRCPSAAPASIPSTAARLRTPSADPYSIRKNWGRRGHCRHPQL